MTQLSIQMLGRFAATIDGEPITEFRTKKVQALLIFLAAVPGPHSRTALTALLWPGLPESSARVNLRQILYQLRKLGPERADKDSVDALPLLVANRRVIQINPEIEIASDVGRLDVLLDRSVTHTHLDILLCPECRHGLSAAVELYRGHFLEDFYLDDSDAFEAWAQEKRLAIRRRILDALGILAAIALRLDDCSHAVDLADRQLALDPLSEHAFRQKMEALARNGRRREALAVYETCRQRLQQELSMAPAARTNELRRRIIADELVPDAPYRGNASPVVRGYELKERIDSGAYGAVHRAFQAGVDREVAIKIIHRHHADNPSFIRRFEAEARIIARLEHPHIVPLYDYWRDPDGAYLVMRFFRPGSLLQAIAGLRWSPARTLTLVEQISSALATAHARGVIHRDIKPGNILLDEAGNAYLSDFGIAKDLGRDTNLTGGGTVLGTLDYISPEQLLDEPVTAQSDIYSLGSVLYETLTGEKPFGDMPVANLIHSHLHQPMQFVTTSRPDLPVALDNVLQRATAKRPADRFSSVLELAAAFRDAVSGSRDKFPVATRETAVAELYNPYKGLRAFQEADVDDFFGRDDLVRQLITRLQAKDTQSSTPHSAQGRFLAVVGPSGSGKSSLVKAGLIPALRNGALPGSESWFFAEMVPGSHPLEALSKALWPIAVDPPPDLVTPMMRDRGGLLRVLRRVLAHSTTAGDLPQLLLVIDQFEELFTLVNDEADRTLFLDSLLTAVASPRSPLRVVVTLRADFYDRPLQRHDFGQLLKACTEVVLPLNHPELTSAVREPARRVGVHLEEGLVGEIIADVADQPGALPLLQYALAELFDARDGNKITLNAYRSVGGVRGALGQRAEALYADLTAESKESARHVFLRLVTLGEGTADTRRRVLRSELEGMAAAGSTAVADVITVFGNARVLTLDRDQATRQPTVEVAHEALLHEWSRLRGWLDESRQDIRLQRQLNRAATEWLAATRESSFLVRGGRLENLAGWARNTPLALTEEERLFLEASQTARENEALAEAAQKERESLLQRRSRNILMMLVGVFGLSTLLAIGLTLYAFGQRDDAQQVRLAAQAQTALDNGDDLVLPALLAIHSLGHGYSPEADAALLGALGRGFTRRFIGHTDSLASIEFSPDGRFVLTASNDTTARLWDAATGQELRQFIGHTELVSHAVFSPDGQWVLTGGADRTVRLWKAATGEELGRLPIHESTVWALAFSPDGSRILSGDESGSFWLWDSQSLSQVQEFAGHSDVVLSTTFTPDGSQIVSGSLDDTARLWDAATGEEIRRFEGHASGVNAVSISPDGRILATASSDNLARLWELASGQPGHTLLGHSNIVNDARFSPDGQWLVTGSHDGTVRVWDVATGREVSQYIRQTGRVNSASFSPSGEYILSGASDPIGRMWNIRIESEPRIFPMPFRTIHSSDVAAVRFSDSERRLVVTSGNGVELVRDVSTGRILAEHEFDTDGLITTVAYSPDGLRVVTADGEGLATLWEARSGRKLRELRGHQGPIWSICFSADGLSVLTGSEDGTARLWNVASGAETRKFIGHTASVQAVAFSPDGQSVLTGSEDATAWLWEVETGLQQRAYVGHTGSVEAVAFSPDGRRVLTGSSDGSARLWDRVSGEVDRALLGHQEGIRVVGFVPNRPLLVTGSDDGTARIWDANTGQVIRQLTGHEGPIRTLAISTDGHLLLTAENRAVHLWQIDMADVIATACAQLPRDFTAEEHRLYSISTSAPTCEEY